jgi:ABC-2 type transport system permease protein
LLAQDNMKKFFILVKKEVKELLTLQMLLPMIGVILVFVFIGKVAGREVKKAQAPQPIAILDLDQSGVSQNLVEVLKKSNFAVDSYQGIGEDDFLNQAKAKNDLLALEIPQGFGDGIIAGQTQGFKTFTVLKNFSLTASKTGQLLASAIAAINNTLSPQTSLVSQNDFVIIGNRMANINPALISGFITSQTTFIPIILFLVIVLASQLIAVSIATEKENKTLETLLSAPVSRNAIVAAKLLGAGIVALFTSSVYLFGMNYYVKGLTASMGANTAVSNATHAAAQQLGLVFGVGDYIILGLSLFFGILAALSVAMILGSFAEDAKSAQGVVTPLMVLILVPYFLVMFLDIAALPTGLRFLVYAIPFSHPFLAAPNILLRQYQNVVYGIIYMAAFFAFFVFLASKIFSTDKILTMRLNFKKKKAVNQ